MNNDILVIALDVGGTTGIAAMHPPKTLLLAEDRWDRAEILAWVCANQPDVLVVEDFRPRPDLPPWSPLPAPKMIGVVEQLKTDGKLPNTKIVLQQPSIKTYFPNRLLKTAGLYTVGKPHANDAVRHALYYLWNTCGFKKHPDVQEVYKAYIAEVKRARREVHKFVFEQLGRSSQR